MSKDKHGLLGTIIKIAMVIVFTAIGACLLTLGAIYRAKGYDIGTYEGEAYNIKWLSICNIVFGACLLTSPFFMSKNRGGLNKVIRFFMVILFFIIGVVLVVGGAIPLAKNSIDAQYRWILICNVTFGACLLTAPLFLKKSMMGSEEK